MVNSGLRRAAVERTTFWQGFTFPGSAERIFATNAALTNQVVEVGTREVVLAQPIHGLLMWRAAIVAVGN
jgi:hypothetical protein